MFIGGAQFLIREVQKRLAPTPREMEKQQEQKLESSRRRKSPLHNNENSKNSKNSGNGSSSTTPTIKNCKASERSWQTLAVALVLISIVQWTFLVSYHMNDNDNNSASFQLSPLSMLIPSLQRQNTPVQNFPPSMTVLWPPPPEKVHRLRRKH